MTDVLTPDLCVIGAGSGGLSVAAAAAAFGVPVVLVEKGRMGGDCLNTGCVPSKALIAAAHHAHAIRSAPAFGIEAGEPRVDFAAVMRHVRGAIATIAPHDSVERFTGLGVQVIEAPGRFVDPDTVEAGGRTIRARRFVVATGSRAAIPPVRGLAEAPHLTNETLFDLAELPGHLLVLGAGAIGCEMAQAFRRLGAAVTLVEAGRALAKEDPEAAAAVLGSLRGEGVTVRENAQVVGAEGVPGRVALVLEGGERLEGSHLLVAAGRRATVDGLGLEAGNVAHTAKGVTVDAGLRSTTNKRVYAVGDVAGGAQFTHAANYHAGLVIRAAVFRLPVKVDPAAIPRATYTAPELAQCGLTEAEARAAHADVTVLRTEVAQNDRAVAEGDRAGFVKVVTDRRGLVLGATIVGTHAGELAAAWQVALAAKRRVHNLSGVVLPYPTRAETMKRAGNAFFTSSLTAPWLRRSIAALRRLG